MLKLRNGNVIPKAQSPQTINVDVNKSLSGGVFLTKTWKNKAKKNSKYFIGYKNDKNVDQAPTNGWICKYCQRN